MLRLHVIRIFTLMLVCILSFNELIAEEPEFETEQTTIVSIYRSNEQWVLPVVEGENAKAYVLGGSALTSLVETTSGKNVEIRIYQNSIYSGDLPLQSETLTLSTSDASEPPKPKCPDDPDDPDAPPSPETMVILGCGGGVPGTVSFIKKLLEDQVSSGEVHSLQFSRSD
jgi:hypothetical protein